MKINTNCYLLHLFLENKFYGILYWKIQAGFLLTYTQILSAILFTRIRRCLGYYRVYISTIHCHKRKYRLHTLEYVGCIQFKKETFVNRSLNYVLRERPFDFMGGGAGEGGGCRNIIMVLHLFSSGTESCPFYFCVVSSWIFFHHIFHALSCKMICVNRPVCRRLKKGVRI